MRFIYIISAILLTSCASQSAMPLGNDLMQIDVSAAPVYGRAGAQQMAFEKAAEATVASGYDKFIVMGSKGWTEAVGGGGAYGEVNANPMFASGSYSSGWSVNRKPEVNMIIKMFHYKDKGSSKAIDAHAIVKSKKP